MLVTTSSSATLALLRLGKASEEQLTQVLFTTTFPGATLATILSSLAPCSSGAACSTTLVSLHFATDGKELHQVQATTLSNLLPSLTTLSTLPSSFTTCCSGAARRAALVSLHLAKYGEEPSQVQAATIATFLSHCCSGAARRAALVSLHLVKAGGEPYQVQAATIATFLSHCCSGAARRAALVPLLFAKDAEELHQVQAATLATLLSYLATLCEAPSSASLVLLHLPHNMEHNNLETRNKIMCIVPSPCLWSIFTLLNIMR